MDTETTCDKCELAGNWILNQTRTKCVKRENYVDCQRIGNAMDPKVCVECLNSNQALVKIGDQYICSSANIFRCIEYDFDIDVIRAVPVCKTCKDGYHLRDNMCIHEECDVANENGQCLKCVDTTKVPYLNIRDSQNICLPKV